MTHEQTLSLLHGEDILITQEIDTLYHSLKASREWECAEKQEALIKTQEIIDELQQKMGSLKDRKTYFLSIKLVRYLRRKQLEKELNHYMKKAIVLEEKLAAFPDFSKETHPNKTLRKLMWKKVLLENMIDQIESGENPDITLEFVKMVTAH